MWVALNLYCCIHSRLSNGNETQHYTYIAVITSFLLDFYTNNMYLVISYLYRKKPILDSLYIFFHVNSSKCMSYIISMCAAALVSSESKIHKWSEWQVQLWTWILWILILNEYSISCRIHVLDELVFALVVVTSIFKKMLENGTCLPFNILNVLIF